MFYRVSGSCTDRILRHQITNNVILFQSGKLESFFSTCSPLCIQHSPWSIYGGKPRLCGCGVEEVGGVPIDFDGHFVY